MSPICHPDRPHVAKGLCKSCYYQANRERLLFASRCRYKKNREAVLARCKRYRKHHPEKQRNSQLKRLYGISLDDYNVMLAAQEGLCKFCAEPLDKTAVVDHNHATGSVRGIIHQRCNIALGFFETHNHLFKNLQMYLGIEGGGEHAKQ